MERKGFFARTKDRIESILPMTFSNLLIFAFILYLLFVVGRSIWVNYESNKQVEGERQRVAKLQSDVEMLQMEIAYYKTQSFKEKEARAKLGYMAPGEKVIVLPKDTPEDQVADLGRTEKTIKTPNYRLWIKYFFN
ncbi:MAG: septum formation initiator family protein [Patescibacteria group bacterium]|jgi:cell division protein FtsB